jgi:hypothetical protein
MLTNLGKYMQQHGKHKSLCRLLPKKSHVTKKGNETIIGAVTFRDEDFSQNRFFARILRQRKHPICIRPVRKIIVTNVTRTYFVRMVHIVQFANVQ